MNTTETTWEVWREHLRGGKDVRIQRGASKGSALRVLRECEDDESLAGFCTFYLVRVTSHRARIAVTS